MVLTKEFKEVVRDAAKKMKGAAKRAFMAQITREYLGGSPRKGERELGWYRKAIEKGLKEQETGIQCVDNYAARGRKKTEEKLVDLERDIRDLVEPDSQVDPKFKTSFRYMRVSAKAVRKALIRDKGYRDEQLPCRQTIGAILNRMGYRLKKTLKVKPLKKIPQTSAIFENVHQCNAASDEDPQALRLSVDTKAKVNIGELSRGGKDRTQQPRQAHDHDTEIETSLVPVGILDVHGSGLSIFFAQGVETSDLIADCLQQWWERQRPQYSQIKELVINLDNGPSVGSHRTQFLKRLVEFSANSGLTIRLIYYPPYHSKYNPVEHGWGVLENYWNGAILDSVETAMQWASNMTWNGIHPVVQWIDGLYEKGVTVGRKEMQALKKWITRSESLPKWDVTIAAA
jgi:transposase